MSFYRIIIISCMLSAHVLGADKEEGKDGANFDQSYVECAEFESPENDSKGSDDEEKCKAEWPTLFLNNRDESYSSQVELLKAIRSSCEANAGDHYEKRGNKENKEDGAQYVESLLKQMFIQPKKNLLPKACTSGRSAGVPIDEKMSSRTLALFLLNIFNSNPKFFNNPH